MSKRYLFVAVIAAALAVLGYFFIVERDLNAPQVRPVANARIAKEQTTASHPRMFKVTVGSEEGIVLAGSVISSFSSRVPRFSPHTCSSPS